MPNFILHMYLQIEMHVLVTKIGLTYIGNIDQRFNYHLLCRIIMHVIKISVRRER